MNLRRAIGATAVSVTALVVTAIFPVHASTQLAPHRAVYSVSLTPESAGGPVLDVDGVMSMSIEETCDGWIFTQDMKTVITVGNGNTVSQSALFTSWESLDGQQYRFASRIKTGDGQVVLRGEAQLNPDGTGTAIYREPREAEVDLPKGTMFPIAHTAWLIDEAKAGVRTAPRIVFTGSEELEAELVNAFIGDYVATADDGAGGGVGNMAAGGGWPLTLAFYPIASETGIPIFEMRALQLENGVSPELQMNFGNFATKLSIERLEPIDRPTCS